MQKYLLFPGGLDLIGREFGKDSVEVDLLLAVSLAELDWGHGLFDVSEHVAVDDEPWQVVAEYDSIAALKAH